jgi:hypothetical protein
MGMSEVTERYLRLEWIRGGYDGTLGKSWAYEV